MVANGLAPFNMVGGDFQSYVDSVIGEVRAMSVELGVMK
jgi:putative tricarboxylic transport membrane protein